MRWDAPAYHDAATVQRDWGRALLDLRDWRGDEVVLDAGCGSGGLVPDILERAPRGRVIALDSDPGMVAEARKRLADFGARVTVLEADLQDLPDLGPVDVVFSNAVLHWVPDHEAAFRSFRRVLAPGGALIAQCGGVGNLERARRIAADVLRRPRFAAAFEGWNPPWNYRGPDETRTRLERAGFTGVTATLHEAPVAFPNDGAWQRFLEAVLLRPYLERVGATEARALLAAYMEAARKEGFARRLDYVRLTLEAEKPADARAAKRGRRA